MKEQKEILLDNSKKEKKEEKEEKDEKEEKEKKEEKKINNEEEISNRTLWDFLFGLGLLGRIIFTLYSLHGLFFIYNLVIQYLILFPSLLFIKQISLILSIPFAIIYCLFALFCSNLLVIPTFDFFSFPFLFYKQPLAHIISFKYTYNGKKFNEDDAKNNYNKFTIIIFIVLEVAYLFGLVMGYISTLSIIKDLVKMSILCLIYIYYIIIILAYFVFSFYLLFCVLLPNGYLKCRSFGEIINEKFKDKEISNLNLFSNILNPYIISNYSKNEINLEEKDDNKESFENKFSQVIVGLKFAAIVFSVVCFFVILFSFLNYWLYYLFFIVFYFIMTIISTTLNFPFLYRNRKTFGTFACCCDCGDCEKKNNIFCTDIEYKKKSLHPHVVSITRILSNLIFLLAAIVFLFLYFKGISESELSQSQFMKIKKGEEIDTKRLLLPNICYSSVYNIPIILYLPFINDAYYYGNIKNNETQKEIKSSFEIDDYLKLFFDDDYVINTRGNLVKEKNTVKMVQYNIKNKKNYITILSIKGTSLTTDIYIDAQLYFSSILLSILSSFSVLTQKDSLTFNLIEYSLNIPYRIFFRFLLIDTYMNQLKKAYVENEYSFYKNVVIVGHSLGGGLAKLFGRFVGKQAISLSGPGINAFHSLWNYQKQSENFEISAIDLVPDKDLVPRVEVSGGTIYRIICRSGILTCHGKELSLCESLIMCRHPAYESYCKTLGNLTEYNINQIKYSSELNNN